MKKQICLLFLLVVPHLIGDGKVVAKRYEPDHRLYKASLEEYAQDAIIIMKSNNGEAVENLILKIAVEGEHKDFAWLIPFPNVPQIYKEKSIVFEELFHFVKFKQNRPDQRPAEKKTESKGVKSAATPEVKVISRKTVGAYDTAVVESTNRDALKQWLEKEGYQSLQDQDNVIKQYIDKKYCFACIKVKDAESPENKKELHPLRFEFKTGGKDGIYFPMKLTGLQQDNFNINLYIFYRYWLNENRNKFGYENLGFKKRHRDWDTGDCIANGAKNWSNPSDDPYLEDASLLIPNVTKLFQKIYPGERFYMTNIYANDLAPEDIRQWKDDLWLFPFYSDVTKIPVDVQNDGVASGFWPGELVAEAQQADEKASDPMSMSMLISIIMAVFAYMSIRMFLTKKQEKKEQEKKGQ